MSDTSETLVERLLLACEDEESGIRDTNCIEWEAAVALAAMTKRAEEAARRLLHMATTNSDDWRWYKQQAQQACRAFGVKGDALDFDADAGDRNG